MTKKPAEIYFQRAFFIRKNTNRAQKYNKARKKRYWKVISFFAGSHKIAEKNIFFAVFEKKHLHL